MLSSLAEGSNLPLPTADKAGLSRDRKGAAHWPSAGAICHSRAIGNPAGLSPPRERPAWPEAMPKAGPGEGATVSFLRKQEPSTPLPLRERPAVPKVPPGEGATVSFLHKQEPRLLCVRPFVSFPPPSVIPAQAAVQNASPHRGRGRRCPRHRRVRGPQCDSCASRNPAGVIPAQAAVQSASPHRGRGRRCPRHRRVRGPQCHSCISRNPVRLSPGGRGWPPVQAGRVRGSQCHSCAPCVIPAQAAVQYASPHRGRGRRCPRHRRVRGPPCDSRASRNPGFFAPTPRVIPA